MKRWTVVRGTFVGLLLVLPALVPAHAVAHVATLSTPTRLEDDDRRMVLRGGWTFRWDRQASGWSERVSKATGASAVVRFDGTGAALVSPSGPAYGIARITLDGSQVATVSLYAAEAASSAVVWGVAGLAPGAHTLTVTASGSREASSADSAIVVDAVDVEGTPLSAGSSGTFVQQSDGRIYRHGPWLTRTSAGASRGSAIHTGSAGATVVVRFTGTGIAWIGRKSPDSGLAEVVLDGQRAGVVGGSADGPNERRVVWSASGLRSKTHTLVIRALGESSAEGSGTAVDVDAFAVTGRVVFAPRPTPFRYPWRTYIVIDKSQCRLYWVKGKVLVKTYPIAHGKRWSYTPQCVWRVGAKYHTSPGSVYGPRKMRLFRRISTSRGYRYVYTRYAIHGTNQPWVIGTMASHGCIRMYNRDVLDLFPRVPLGTMVITRA